MIALIVNGKTLPLPPGYRLTRDAESTVFNKEDDVFDFTYPVDLPLTDDVRLAFGFPDVLAISGFKTERAGTLIIDGIYNASVTIKVLGVSKSNKTCRISVIGQYASMAKIFGSKKVNELTLGGYRFLSRETTGFDEIYFETGNIIDGLYNFGKAKVTYRAHKTNAYMTALANGSVTDDFLFPKSVDVKPDSNGTPGVINIFNAWDASRSRYVDAEIYNFLANDWNYLAPSFFKNDQRHYWVPMFRLVYVLRRCFEESGITVKGDVFTDTLFKDIVLYNTCALGVGAAVTYIDPFPVPGERYLEVLLGSGSTFLDPKNHVPDMPIMEFITELSKRYNWQFKYDAISKTVTIRRIGELLNNPVNIIDLSAKVDPEATITIEEDDAYLRGYKLIFSSDASDTATSDNVMEDVAQYRYRTEVATPADITSITSPVAGDIGFVKSVNAYYQYQSGMGWVLYSQNLAPYSTTAADGLQEVTTKIVSPPMSLFTIKMINMSGAFSGWTAYDNNTEVVPWSNMGVIPYSPYGYFNFGADNGTYTYFPGTGVGHPWLQHYHGILKLNLISYQPHVVTWAGLRYAQLPSVRVYAMGTSGQYNSRGELMNIYSGSWNSPGGYGIYKDSWKKFAERIQDGIVADWQVELDAVTYANLDINSTEIRIDNLRYLIKRVKIVMPFPDVSTLTLVRM